MVRARGRYRNQVLELEQPLAFPDGTPVEVDVLSCRRVPRFRRPRLGTSWRGPARGRVGQSWRRDLRRLEEALWSTAPATLCSCRFPIATAWPSAEAGSGRLHRRIQSPGRRCCSGNYHARAARGNGCSSSRLEECGPESFFHGAHVASHRCQFSYRAAHRPFDGARLGPSSDTDADGLRVSVALFAQFFPPLSLDLLEEFLDRFVVEVFVIAAFEFIDPNLNLSRTQSNRFR